MQTLQNKIFCFRLKREQLRKIIEQDFAVFRFAIAEREEALKLILRRPHREIRAEERLIHAEMLDAAAGVLRTDRKQRAARIIIDVRAAEHGAGIRPLAVAAEMRGDAQEIRQLLQHVCKTARRGKIHAVVARMEQHRQPSA